MLAAALAGVGGGATLLAPGAEAAEGEVSTSRQGAILHRRLPAPAGGGGSAPVFVYDPRRGGALPREVQRDGVVMPMPDPNPAAADEDEAVYADGGLAPAGDEPGGAAPDPSALPRMDVTAGNQGGPTEGGGGPGSATGSETLMDPRGTLGSSARPDRDTEMEGTLGYHTVFDPSVVPFKRNRSLNRVAPDGTLRIVEEPLRPVRPAGNHVTPERDVFWGSLLIEATPDQPVPLPSVSPDSRILSYETTPATAVTFFRDSADNYYVQAATAGRFRLVFLMDASVAYFGRALPPEVTARQVPPRLRPRLPGTLQDAATTVYRRIGLRPGQPIAEQIGALVTHFRSFEPGEPPRDTGDVYLDLALGGRGICRHRAYAFVITAHALGIPARYVFNEAHVFVEAWVPGADAGWIRVDLGGGAERLVVHGAEDKLRHRGQGQDPFTQPEPYARQLRDEGASAGATEVIGLPPTRRRAPGGGVPGGAEVVALGGGLLPPPVARIAHSGARSTVTRLEIAEAIVYRGDMVIVSGEVTSRAGRGIAEGKVQLLLLDGRQGATLGLLGVAGVGAGGRFRTEIRLPEDQPPGGYEVVAEFLGTPNHAPSRSR